jgi:hypothetical protein
MEEVGPEALPPAAWPWGGSHMPWGHTCLDKNQPSFPELSAESAHCTGLPAQLPPCRTQQSSPWNLAQDRLQLFLFYSQTQQLSALSENHSQAYSLERRK